MQMQFDLSQYACNRMMQGSAAGTSHAFDKILGSGGRRPGNNRNKLATFGNPSRIMLSVDAYYF